jgi:hypothetical protein
LEGKEPNKYTGSQEVNPFEKEKDKKHQSLAVQRSTMSNKDFEESKWDTFKTKILKV